jgi:hypothetical protein
MLKDHSIKSYLVYSVIAALLYSVAAYIFIRNETFDSSWMLYVGNALFGCCIVTFIILYNKKRKENASTGTMITAGHITTVMGIIITCIIILFLFFLVHGVHQADVLNDTPPQMESGKRHQFLLALFMNAVIGNVSVGSFVSLIVSYAVKRDQKGSTSVKTKEESELFNQNKD